MGRSAHESAASVAHNRAVPVDTKTFIDQLRERVEGTSERAAAEDLLAEGYARALALEAESRRLQARVNALAAGLNAAGDASVIEIAEVARRRAEVDGEHLRLREALVALRRGLAVA
jgi:secreted protein with Ig-like and vWFA domain